MITPADVLECARSLGILLPARGPNGEAPDPQAVQDGEYYLLPLACELIHAPLPGEWREIMIDGKVHFREGATGTTSLLHPLTEVYCEIVAVERRRPRPKMRYVSWLQGMSERAMQFVSPSGDVYSYDFGACLKAADIPTLIHMAMLGERDESSFAAGDKAAVQAAHAAKEASRCSCQLLGGRAAAGAAAAQSDEALDAQAKDRQLRNSSFSRLLGRTVYQHTLDSASESDEGRLKRRLMGIVHGHFDPIIGISLATCPRQLRVTFDVALALGIDLVKDVELIWLADLVQSLPSPLGWAVAEHPVTEQPDFWHNELTGVSQWQHPTDEFIKSLVVALRSPLQPRAKNVVTTLLGGEEELAKYL